MTPAGGEIHATKIDWGDEFDVEEGDQFEITGFVAHLVSAFEFTIGNQVVHTDASTLFVDGTADDLAPWKKLEIDLILVDGIFLTMKWNSGNRNRLKCKVWPAISF